MDGVEKVGGVENQAPNLATSAPTSETTSDSKLPSMSPVENWRAKQTVQQYEVDDRGTDQDEAVKILTKIKAEAFEASDEQLALALGRPVEEIQAWTKGEQTIDSDVLMKARALALERGLRIDEAGDRAGSSTAD
jgi:hypothetical protein